MSKIEIIDNDPPRVKSEEKQELKDKVSKMAINPKITSALKTFSGKPLGVMSKALGVASVASVALVLLSTNHR